MIINPNEYSKNLYTYPGLCAKQAERRRTLRAIGIFATLLFAVCVFVPFVVAVVAEWSAK